jgi:hypothetical protein
LRFGEDDESRLLYISRRALSSSKGQQRVKVFTGKNGSLLGENDRLSMRGKAWKKKMGKFSLSS